MDSTKCFVHIQLLDRSWKNFTWDFKHIPRKYDLFSLSPAGAIYEVDYTFFNCFDCQFEIEIYAHETE